MSCDKLFSVLTLILLLCTASLVMVLCLYDIIKVATIPGIALLFIITFIDIALLFLLIVSIQECMPNHESSNKVSPILG